MLCVFLFIVRIYDHIIQVSNTDFSQNWGKDMVYNRLKSSRGVLETKRHRNKLIESHWTSERSLGNIRVFYRDLPKRRVEVNTSKDLSRPNRGQDIIYDWQWVVVPHGQIIETAVVHAWTPRAIGLLDQ